MTRAPSAGRDAGFTLVEALVSLFVFSLIAAGATGLLAQSVRSQRAVLDAQESLQSLQVTRALLQNDAAHIVLRAVRDADGTQGPAFLGGAAGAALAFTRIAAEPSDEGRARTSLSRVEYVLRDGALVRVSRDRLDLAPGAPAAEERVLLRDAAEARFEFYDGAQWRPSWIAQTRASPPPRAIAFVFTSRAYGEIRIEALVGLSP